MRAYPSDSPIQVLIELATGCIKGILCRLGDSWPDERAAVFVNELVQEGCHREGKKIGIFMASSDHFAAQHPDVIAVPKQCIACVSQGCEMLKKGRQYGYDCLSSRNIFVIDSPRSRPVMQVWNALGERLLFGDNGRPLPVLSLLTVLLTRLLNACHHFPGFVYEGARLCEATQSIEIDVRPRKGSKPVCSCCNQPARGYDSPTERRFEFIPVWGFAVFLLYTMRRVDCRACGVKVEALPWANGKHTLTRAYMIFLAQWARKLSWKETAQSFRTSWEKVFNAVEWVVDWGLAHRELGTIRAFGVDEIQYRRLST